MVTLSVESYTFLWGDDAFMALCIAVAYTEIGLGPQVNFYGEGCLQFIARFYETLSEEVFRTTLGKHRPDVS